MPINLLKMPYLVGVGIVTELDYEQIFLLSLCSRRTKCLVEKARIKVPKLMFNFGKYEAFETFVIWVVSDKKWLYVTSMIHVPKLDLNRVSNVNPAVDDLAETNTPHITAPLRTVDYELADKEHVPELNLEEDLNEESVPDYNVIYGSRYLKKGSIRHCIECANEPMAVQKTFQDITNSIFHYSDTCQLILKCKGRLPNIANVKHIEIKHDTVDTEFLTNVLMRYPDPHTLSVKSTIVGDIPEDSSFFQIQNIYVASQCGPDYFHNFVGRNMFLERVTVTEQDLIQFVDRWISNEAYHNLETLSIFIDYPLIMNVGLIRQAIEFEEYDPNEPEKRPEHFVIDAPFFQHCAKDQYSLRNENVVEIKRNTDGKRAFLSIYPTHFQFITR
ncbi:hypothetical protein B9Z55_016657 [Caenorhabditis nigoni]|uniref:F-box domain-containing protein n=1 Tax=Caenorhabditis nigoni TaxID=1611254 RepID=A0A2G5T668_9PELO|nr:hypothetical protein B9Z55_016657 [Caenorhabditis nigoni]